MHQLTICISVTLLLRLDWVYPTPQGPQYIRSQNSRLRLTTTDQTESQPYMKALDHSCPYDIYHDNLKHISIRPRLSDSFPTNFTKSPELDLIGIPDPLFHNEDKQTNRQNWALGQRNSLLQHGIATTSLANMDLRPSGIELCTLGEDIKGATYGWWYGPVLSRGFV